MTLEGRGGTSATTSGLRVLIVGNGCSPVPCPSDKQFIRDLVAALPAAVTIAIWTLGDIPPGIYPIAGRPAGNLLHSELRIGHDPLTPADAYAPHPTHSPLRNAVEISSSMVRAGMGSLSRLIRRFQPDLVHFADNSGPSTWLLRQLHPRLPFVMCKPTVAFHRGARARVYAAYVRSSLAGADRVITQTAAARDGLIALGVDAADISVVPWGVPPPPACSPARIGAVRAGYGVVEKERLVVVSLRGGASDAVRTLRQVAEAARALPLRFVIAIRPGLYDDTMAALEAGGSLQGLPAAIRIERGPEDFYDLLWAADALLAGEGSAPGTSLLPLTWLEAMARGTPVITESRPGGEECVRDGETGLVVEAGGAPYPALEALLRPELLARLSEGARRCVAQHFSIDAAVARYLALWSGVGEK